MDIIVKGTASEYFKPEQVRLDIDVEVKGDEYEKTLRDGTQATVEFVEQVLPLIELTKDDFKTRNFCLREVYTTVYNEKTQERKQVFDGYKFNQEAHIKFDYDVKKMTTFMSKTAELKNPPRYTIKFEVKDEETRKNEVLSKAYQAAKIKAEAISAAAGIKLVKCLKTDFKAFESQLTSNSQLKEKLCLGSGYEEKLENTFTPEDICVSETLYCLWLAE